MRGWHDPGPDARLECHKDSTSLPGYEPNETWVMKFYLPAGVQGLHEPLPGAPYESLTFTTFLPADSEGNLVKNLLQVAWRRGLLFRIGFNVLTQKWDALVVNGFDLKRCRTGGAAHGGFPDPNYLPLLKMDLKSVGLE